MINKTNKERTKNNNAGNLNLQKRNSGHMKTQSDGNIILKPVKKTNVLELRRREDAMKLNLYNEEVKQKKENVKEKTIE